MSCSLNALLQLLRELDLSHDSSKDESVEVASQQPANVTAVEAMAAITSLTSLDLSRCGSMRGMQEAPAE